MDENNEVNENVNSSNNGQTTTINATMNPTSGEYETTKREFIDDTVNDPHPLNIACLVAGLLSVFNDFIPGFQFLPGYLYGIAAIVLYILGHGKKGKGVAIAGLIIGIIGTILSVLKTILLLLGFKALFTLIIEAFKGLFIK